MKKYQILGLAAFILISANNVFAQNLAPTNASARLTKVTQIGYYMSGSTRMFLLKGNKSSAGVVTDNFQLKGTVSPGVSEDCLELISKQNLNSLGQSSNLLLNFTNTFAAGYGVGGGPSTYLYEGVVLKSCYLTNS